MQYIWGSGDTWHRVAFLQYGDETRYREILNANPNFTIIDTPQQGETITVPSIGTDSLFGNDSLSDRTDRYYFPWVNPSDYYDRLLEYNGVALVNKLDQNGLLLTTS